MIRWQEPALRHETITRDCSLFRPLVVLHLLSLPVMLNSTARGKPPSLLQRGYMISSWLVEGSGFDLRLLNILRLSP